MLLGAWTDIVGIAPVGLEFLPYIFANVFLLAICVYILQFFIYMFFKIFKG